MAKLNGQNILNKKINSKKVFKISLIVYSAILIAGIVFGIIFGVSLDINFKGGTRINYSFEGKIKEADFTKAVGEVITKKFSVSRNKSIAGDTETFTVSLVGKKSLSAKLQETLTEKLNETFPDNNIELYDSNSVSPTVAGTFFLKSLVAVLIAAALVVIYVGIRFKKIGGVTAAITALCALVLDLMVTFVVCVIFRLQIDSNYIAVVLTILGYSLNDTIVCYDRVRENKKLFPELTTEENMNDTSLDTDSPVAGGLNFDGLYDEETERGTPAENTDDDVKKKTKVPVIICIVCAIICIIATLLILFIIWVVEIIAVLSLETNKVPNWVI